MEEQKPRRRGRPPSPPRTMPMFLWQVRSRVNVQMIVSAPTARDLRNYVDWAERLTGMSADEVLVRTVDHALTQYFKSDKLWRKERSSTT